MVFSTAFPAIATMTSPANAFGTPTCFIAGVSDSMNQSATNAAPTPAAPSSASASHNGTRGSDSGRSDATSDRR